MAFGGKVSGQHFGTATTSQPRLNLLRMEEDLSAAHLRLSRTYVENLPWETCIKKYDRPQTLFYCDPPYWGTEGYGINFPLEEYAKLAKLANTIKGSMIISVNDTPEMRSAFSKLHHQKVDIAYTLNPTQRKKTAELIIKNF